MKYIITIVRNLFILTALLIVIVFVIVHSESDKYITTSDNLPKDTHIAIVLGASVLSNGTLSLVLKDRVDTAIDLYKQGKVTTILVTGDNGTLTHNEVNPSRDYLLTQGIPEKAIVLDHAGFDTYSSMYRARDVFTVEKAIIVTQSFHLPRAVFIARSLGIDAYGVSADKHEYLLKNSLREIFADVKAVLDLLIKRKPKYLGAEIPIQ